MQTVSAPPPTRTEPVFDVLHGQKIEDRYRWLEAAESPETQQWVDDQNAYTHSLLDVVPGRERIHRRLEELLSIGNISAPVVLGTRYFYLRREGDQNQPILYVRDGRDSAERVLLDPNEESQGGTVTLDWWYPSWDGALVAFGCSGDGDEWSTLRVVEVESGAILPDTRERARYASLAWLSDGSGFFYTRYPRQGDVPEGEENYHKRLFFHRLGTSMDGDAEVHVTALEKEDMLNVSISPDGRYLLASVFKGWERSDLYLRDLHAGDSPFIPVAQGYDALFSGAIADGTLYIHTNLDAPRYRLFATNVAQPTREHWREIVPEREHVLQSVTPAGRHILTTYLRHATSALVLFDAEGQNEREIELPGIGSVTAITGEWEQDDAFYSFESFTYPPTIYRFDARTGVCTLWDRVEVPIDPEEYEVRQEWYTSEDGTRVSMFIVHRRGLEPGIHPTILSGYGGFNVSMMPLFSRGLYLWLEHGGVYALPNLRGGAEYGEEWHREGMLDRKQNVFDDFIAAAEHLIAQGYTEPAKLAIQGGSNGGLLVGAALTQHPELFRAVVCAVPLLDMLRYHHFLIARLWIPEYGSADDPDQFRYLLAYSPYHHVTAGTFYPAVLLTTAGSDTRVDPMHARKMAALLQAYTASEHPVLLRVETQAGHGVGKPLAKVLEEQTDSWSFLFWQLGVPA